MAAIVAQSIILRRWETIATVRAAVRDCPDVQRHPIRIRLGADPWRRCPEIARECGATVGQERPSGKPGGLFLLSSLRANGSRECEPDDRLREAIQSSTETMDCFVADAPRNDGEGRCPCCAASSAFRSTSVIVREGGRSSTPRALDSIVGACEYWMTAFAGMTTCGAILSGY